VYGTSGRYVPADEMYIDTEAANKGAKPKVTVSSSSPVAYREEQTPLLDAFVGQEAPPPSYLEATTPLGWHVRPSGDEAERLLEDGNGRRPPFTPLREEVHKDGKYRRRSLAEHCTKKKMLKWMAAILAVVILAVIIAAAMHQNNKVWCFSGERETWRVNCYAEHCSVPNTLARRACRVWSTRLEREFPHPMAFTVRKAVQREK